MFASSSEIYGDAETIPTPESSWGRVNPAGVRSSYFYPGTDWSTSSNVTSRTASVVVVFPPVAIGLTEADNSCTNFCKNAIAANDDKNIHIIGICLHMV